MFVGQVWPDMTKNVILWISLFYDIVFSTSWRHIMICATVRMQLVKYVIRVIQFHLLSL